MAEAKGRWVALPGMKNGRLPYKASRGVDRLESRAAAGAEQVRGAEQPVPAVGGSLTVSQTGQTVRRGPHAAKWRSLSRTASNGLPPSVALLFPPSDLPGAPPNRFSFPRKKTPNKGMTLGRAVGSKQRLDT